MEEGGGGWSGGSLPFPNGLIGWYPLYGLGKNRLLAVLDQDTEGMQTENGEGAIRQRGRAELITEDLTDLEGEDLVSLDGVEVVVHGQEDQEGSKHGDGGEEVPNVVVVKE